MLFFLVIVLATVFYIGPLYLPSWFTREEVVAKAILPFSYEQAKALFILACFLAVYIFNRRKQRRNKMLFRVPQKGEKGRLHLPGRKRGSGSAGIAVVLGMLILVFIVTGYSQAFGGGRMVSINRDIVNMRTGPATSYRVLWKLGKGYPRKDGYQKKESIQVSNKRLVSTG